MSLKLLIFLGVEDSDDEHEVGDPVKGAVELILGSFEVIKLSFHYYHFRWGIGWTLSKKFVWLDFVKEIWFVFLFVCLFFFSFLNFAFS